MLCEGTKGLGRTVWTRTKILSPNICYFVAVLKFVAIYALLEIFEKRAFGVKNSVVWAKKCTNKCMVCILN